MTTNTQIARTSLSARLVAGLRKLSKDRRGATTVEYLVLLAFVGLGGIAAITALGDAISTKAEELGTAVGAIAPG
jgi:Flp pilus assembly pilin Flp